MKSLHALLAGALGLAVIAVGQSYKVTDHWKIGGQGGWDYLVSDDAAHRLYLTHGTTVDAVDTTTGKLIGSVKGLARVHGIALDPNGRTGYISEGGTDSVIIFDRSDLSITAKVPAGKNPDCILFETATKTVWVFNGGSKDVTVIDPTGHSAAVTVKLPGRPEFARSDMAGHIYVNLEDKNSIVKLSLDKPAVMAVWQLHECESPSGMAIDRKGHRLFSVCDGGKMAIIDYASGQQLGSAKIGGSPDAAAYDAKHSLAFSSNGDGTLSVVDARSASFATVQTLDTQRGARTMAYDEKTGTIYLAAAKYGPTPKPTEQNPRPRPTVLPDTFEVLVVKRDGK